MNDPVTLEQLEAAGFKPSYFSSLEGPSLMKQMKAREMPHVKNHLMGTLGVSDSDTVYIEAQVGGQVTMGIEVVGYHEEPVSIDSEEGRALLKDAGLSLDPPSPHIQP